MILVDDQNISDINRADSDINRAEANIFHHIRLLYSTDVA